MKSAYTQLKRLFPSLCIKVFPFASKGNSERFTIQMAGGEVHIQAASFLAEQFAVSRLLTSLQSGQLGWSLGMNVPLFEKRFLWVNGTDRYLLSNDVELHLPPWIISEDLDARVEQIISLGYNSVVLAALDGCTSDQKQVSLSKLKSSLEYLRTRGLQVIIEGKPVHQEIDRWLEVMGTIGSDFLFCRQGFLSKIGFSCQNRDPTTFEKAAEEIAFLEKNSKIPIFYAVTDSSDASFLLCLNNLISSKSMIAFSARDHRQKRGIHELFSSITRIPIEMRSRLVPLLPIKQYTAFEGTLFSDFPMQFLENVLGRQKEHLFCGVGCQIEELPDHGTLAECPLWIAGQKMWQNAPTHSFTELWFEQHHPDWKELFQSGSLHEMHYLLSLCEEYECQLRKNLIIKAKKTIEQLAYELKKFSVSLIEYRNESECRRMSPDLEVLFALIFQFQSYVKIKNEKLCQEFGLKIPLFLQELHF